MNTKYDIDQKVFVCYDGNICAGTVKSISIDLTKNIFYGISVRGMVLSEKFSEESVAATPDDLVKYLLKNIVS